MDDLSLVIHTSPPLALYLGARPDVDRAWPRLADAGEISSSLRIDGGATSHVDVRADNGDGALTPLFAAGPLLVEASLHHAGAEIWRGAVSRLSIGPVLLLGLEA